VLFAPFVLLMRGDCFRADQELIDLAGRVFTLRDLNEELRNFARAHRQRKGGWRERVLVGLSTERLRQLGRRYLPVGSAGWIEAEG